VEVGQWLANLVAEHERDLRGAPALRLRDRDVRLFKKFVGLEIGECSFANLP
jgi:hypothetical protein